MSSVQVGILHSKSGTIALSEAPLVEAALMAIAEINQAGGVLGECIEPVIEDGASDPNHFEFLARKLIQHDQVVTVFGCYTSAARKAVLPVLEQLNAQLWYPAPYEGLEASKHIFYTGSCPNQQVEPALSWLLQNQGKRFYLLGSDCVFSRTVNKIIKAQLQQNAGTVVGEDYIPLGIQECAPAIAKIGQARPDVVFNTLQGDSNVGFYRQYQSLGLTATQIPIMTVTIAEAELQEIGDAATGHYACWSYFHTLETSTNRQFVRNFQRCYGANRVTSDPIATAYTQVYLWKQAVEQAQSFEVNRVRVAAYGQSFESPSGLVRIEPNHHVERTCRIGRILPTGQFEIIYSSDRPIKPLPWLGVEQLNVEGSINYQQLSNLQPSNLQPSNLQPSNLQPSNLQPSNLQPSNLQPSNLQLSNLQPSNLESATPEIPQPYRWNVVRELLGEVSQGIYQACQMEQKSRELKAAKAQLQDEINKRRRVETVLLDSEAELQALFAAMTDIVIVLNAQGRYLKIAPTNPALLYKPANELIGKTLHEVFPPEQADIFMGYLQQALYSRQTVNVEYSRRTFTGQEIWLAASISPLSDDAVVWVASDITERRKAEEILRNIALGVSAATGEAFFHLLVQYLAKTLEVECAFVGELVESEPQRIRTVAVCAYGQMLENFDYHIEHTACQQVLQQGLCVYPSHIQQQFPLDLLLQEMRAESYLGIPLLDSTGRALGLLVVLSCQPFADTRLMEKIVQIFAVRAAAELERRQAEVALRKAEERYRSIFENTDKGLFQLAPDGRYLSANPALAVIFGYSSPEELIQALTNVNQQLYVDPKYRAKCLILLREHGTLPNFQFQAYRKDGGMIWIVENAHVVRGDRGELLYYEGSVIDITERKIWEEALRYHQECTEDLLLNILPEPIAERLKMAESTIADSFAEVTVLFGDLVNFTEISAQILPTELVELLNKIFSNFDQLAENHNLEKIKTIGDAYMVVGGLPHPRFDHVEAVADMALDMQQEISHFKRHDGTPFYLRIGIHTGPVVAGVIGMKKFSYDLWGDTVNVANRMESQGLPGGIQVTETVYEYLKDKYYLERRGAIVVKGKGEMITYWLTGKKPSQHSTIDEL